jgi:serine/threonine-protein kinase
MSPAQVAAEKDLDGRSDVYSLACVLYEMLAGQPPFIGPNSAAIMARHALEMPPSLTVVRSTIPDEIEEVVFQALAKSRVDRFESAGDFADALQDCLAIAPTVTRRVTAPRVGMNTSSRRRYQKKRKALLFGAIAVPAAAALVLAVKLASGSGGPPAAVSGALDVKKVAVLYFEDETNGKLGYLADGLTETLIEQLNQVQQLNDVISKEGVGRFRNQDVSLDSVGKALQVGTIVTGKVDENGPRARITIRIIDANSGAEKDSRGFELAQTDPLQLRSAVADSVRTLLGRYLGETIRLRELALGTGNAAAWTLVQRAEKLRKDAVAAAAARDSIAAARDFAQADSMLAEAERMDSRWASPVALRSLVALGRAQASRGASEARPWAEEGIAHATRAIQLDSSNVDAWELRGRLRYLTRQRGIVADANAGQAALDGAEADLEKAVELDKTRAGAWSVLGSVRSSKDNPTGAKLAALRAFEEDAFQANIENVVYNLYLTSYNLEDADDAQRWCREGFTRFPKNRLFVGCRLWLRTMSRVTANVDSAWSDARDYEALSPPASAELARLQAQLLVAATVLRAGQPDSARRMLVQIRAAATPDVDPGHSILGYEAFVRTLFKNPGDTDEAIALLRRYVSTSPAHREGLAKSQHWWWRPLMSDPRYQALVAGR